MEGIQISGIVSAQTGHPYSTFANGFDNGRTSIASFSCPDVIGNPFAGAGPQISASGVRTEASNLAAFSNTFLGHLPRRHFKRRAQVSLLLCKPFDFYSRSGPVHGSLRHCDFAVCCHEIGKGQHDNTLREQISVPSGKPYLSLIKQHAVLAGTQNKFDPRKDRTLDLELLSDY
jgi:hypothetical protein